MRVRLLVRAVVAGSLLVVAMSPPVEAPRGLGKGRGRQVETMRAFSHPYAWAAFGLSGLPR